MQSLFHSILSDLCFSRRIQFNTFNFHFTKKKKLFHLSSFLKLALHFTQFFPFYFKISISNNFPSVTFIYSHNFSSSSSIGLIRNLLKGKNKLKKKKRPSSPASLERGPMSARGLQHGTIGLRAWRAPIRADFQKIENPLVHSKLVRVPGYPGWPLFPFRFDRRRGGRGDRESS